MSENQYLYNGKERQEELGLRYYNYGARFYDPAIGRFMGVDPISDQFPQLSTFNYASNDPIGKIDLHGLQGVSYTESFLLQSSTSPEDATASTSNSQNFSINIIKASKSNSNELGNGSGSITMFSASERNETGGTAISMGAKGSSLDAQANVQLGTNKAGVLGETKGSLFSAETNLDAGFLNDQNGQTGVILDANGGAFTAKGEVSFGISAFGAKLTGTVGGSLLSAHAGFTIGATKSTATEKITIQGFQHFGFGIGEKLGIKLELPSFSLTD